MYFWALFLSFNFCGFRAFRAKDIPSSDSSVFLISSISVFDLAYFSSRDRAVALPRWILTSALSNVGEWTIPALEVKRSVVSEKFSITASRYALESLTVSDSSWRDFFTDAKGCNCSIKDSTLRFSEDEKVIASISSDSSESKNCLIWT